MSNQPIDPNAKQALNNLKMEIANEIQDNSNILNDGNIIDSIGISARVGGQISKKLVELGEKELLRQYNKDNL